MSCLWLGATVQPLTGVPVRSYIYDHCILGIFLVMIASYSMVQWHDPSLTHQCSQTVENFQATAERFLLTKPDLESCWYQLYFRVLYLWCSLFTIWQPYHGNRNGILGRQSIRFWRMRMFWNPQDLPLQFHQATSDQQVILTIHLS